MLLISQNVKLAS